MSRPALEPDDVAPLLEVQARSFARAGPRIRQSYPPSRAMDARRMADFLGSHRHAVLATARPDGRPQAAPVSYLVWRGAFWIALVAGARERNLRANPYASLVLVEGEGRRHRALIANGPVVLHDPRHIHEIGEGLAAAWAKRFRQPPTWAAVLVELRPARLYSYGQAS
ncbi:MAG: pyridoxamine 5'-phosphate oxidase family protein [Armatimonadota bacterium]|nr:pyridoxamine 5'-phosphate oxidase family protein [Armatimonadota bacterium]MDR5696410.1 pyridoxamine 5'-phosphate oxidase family protein [Armatimonadota bacterium]